MQTLKKIHHLITKVSWKDYKIHSLSKVSCCQCRFFCDYFDKLDENKQEVLAYEELTSHYLGSASGGHNTFVLQPYIKWGPDKRKNTTPELQLAEAVSLINTLPNWAVVDKMCVPLLSLEKKKLLGSGNLNKLQKRIKENQNVTAIFVSTNLLKHVQIRELEEIFGLPVFDRYSIIIHIFRAHAKSPEARLQVSLAEIPYVWKKMNEIDTYKGGRINSFEVRKSLLHSRQLKLRNALKKLKEHRRLLRNNTKRLEFPSISVVGYTNAGKTSLIKALTGDNALKPQNKLFATLDTTAHEGMLPCKLRVLYMDTIGFIQDVPETLLEPFVVTLEDAMIADVIVHVYDISHPDFKAQFQHVEKTIAPMIGGKPVINVANKCDLVKDDQIPEDALAISSVTLQGIDVLRSKIQKEILTVTERTFTRIRVLSGSPAAAWLYKETTVVDAEADPNNAQYLIMDVIATPLSIQRFKMF